LTLTARERGRENPPIIGWEFSRDVESDGYMQFNVDDQTPIAAMGIHCHW